MRADRRRIMRTLRGTIVHAIEAGSSSARRAVQCAPLVLVLLILGAPRAPAAPCDIYGRDGTPCVAAHSTTRALYARYDGPLYKLSRSSDAKTMDVRVTSVGGYADAAAQDRFCADTRCTITEIYDQSPNHNDLRIGPRGVQGKADIGAPAEALAVTAGGHPVYGVEISAGMGYRDDRTRRVATDGRPEGMYMVTSGTHANAGCCFDYGNAEVHNNDPGDGHMDALNFGTGCHFKPCYGRGPWVRADLENGLFESDAGFSKNPHYTGNPQPFVTAMLKNNGRNHFALHSADAGVKDGLLTIWDGADPPNTIHGRERSRKFGYTPMHQEGAIVLGVGGDNSNASIGSFFEGAMTRGYPSDKADRAVQNDIASVDYSTSGTAGAPGTLEPGSEISLRATTACCTGDYLRHSFGKVVISAISSGSAATDRADATWIVRRGLARTACVSFESRNYPGDYIRHSFSKLYRQPYDGTALNASDATFCPMGGKSGKGESFQSVNYPSRYIRHYYSVGYIASDGGAAPYDSASSWADDVSWIVSAPLAP